MAYRHKVKAGLNIQSKPNLTIQTMRESSGMGTYITWMEEARIEYLRSIGVEFADLVALGCDLPVVELSLRYHLPIRLGVSAMVKTRLIESKGVRIEWDYEIQSFDREEIFVSGKGRAGGRRPRKRQDHAPASACNAGCLS